MIKLDDFQTTYAVAAQFYHDVDSFQIELGGVASSFSAIEASHSENLLTEEAYNDAIFGMRVSVDAMAERLRNIIENNRLFPCVMVKEAK